MATRMPNARLAQKEPRPPIQNTMPPNAFSPAQVLGWHERRLAGVEKVLENLSAQSGGNVGKADPKLAVLSERIDRLAELLEALSTKVSHMHLTTTSDDEDGEDENVELEVEEN